MNIRKIKANIISNEALEYVMAESRGVTRKCKNHYEFAISDTSKSSKKITISQNVIEQICCTEIVKIGFTKRGIVIGSKLAKGKKVKKYFVVRQNGSGYIIYSTQLVREINEKFRLRYSKKGTCKIDDVVYHRENDMLIAHIILVPRENE